MKMLMIIANSKVREELEILLKREGVTGYTEVPDVHGLGSSGPRMGSVVHPDTSSMILVLLEDAKVKQLTQTIRDYCSDCAEHIRIAHWPVEIAI
jgi:nitrogen regulatory protein PII